MLRKTVFTLLLICSLGAASAQVTYFSENTGTYSVDTSSFFLDLQNQLPLWLPDGNIGVVSTGDANSLVFRTFSPSGELLSTFADLSAANYYFQYLTGVEITPDQSSIIISGSSYYSFYIAKMNIATKEVSIAEYPVPYAYVNAPNVNVTASGIYAVFPTLRYSIAAKYNPDLSAVWAKGFVPDSTDTTASKHPSMGGYCDDTTFWVTSKDDSLLSIARLSAATGITMSYKRFPDPGGYIRIYSATRLSDGNMALAGLVNSYDPFIMKCSFDGDTVFWAKKITDPMGEVANFEGVVELPDGRLMAMCAEYEHTRSFFALSTFDSNGNLLHTRRINSTSGAGRASMSTPVVDANGILAAGSMTPDWTQLLGILQYTDFDLSQACDVQDMTLLSEDYFLGTPTELTPSGITSWDMPITGVSHTFTLAPTVSENPVACGLVSSSKPVASTHPTISPNPVSNGMDVLLSLGKVSQCSVTLVDAAGRVLRNESFTGSQHLLNTEGLNTGVYMVRVASSDGLIHTQRLLVQ